MMVRFIEELSELNAPIVFKGAIVLKTALKDSQIATQRGTRDVDGDWVMSEPTMEVLLNTVSTALSKVGDEYSVVVTREYGANKSAGFSVQNIETLEQLFTFDLSVKKNPFYSTYYSTVNGIAFRGATPAKMVADKLHGISTRTVFRRCKDIVDLYLLSSLTCYS